MDGELWMVWNGGVEEKKEGPGEDQSPAHLQIGPHSFRINPHIEDEIRESGHHEVRQDARIGGDYSFNRAVADISLMPQHHVLQ